MTPDDPATQYARAVADGSAVAGPQVRDACRRHLRDLTAGTWTWDVKAVQRALGFFRDVLKLNGGEHENLPFVVEPWQAFIIGSLFGWKGPDGFRRFRMAYVEGGKGCGKSPLAAGIGLYCLVADQEPRAEVYAAASRKDQAMVLFRDAVAMVRLSPTLGGRCQFSGGIGREWNIAYLATSSFFRAIASDDGQSGPRPHCALLDEIHEHRDNEMVEMLRAGTKGRRQALIFMITNSGFDRTKVCWHYHVYASKIAAGDLEDESFFGYVCALDPDDDPFTDESCWRKANPSLGVTITDKYLRELVTQAKGMPSKEAVVRRLNFCQWTDAYEMWIDRDLWDACEEDFDEKDLRGEPCWLGLDLSNKRDLTSMACVWRRGSDGHLFLKSWSWTPGATLDQRARTDAVPYRTWAQEGHIFAPEGRLIDKRHVAKWLMEEFLPHHDVQSCAYDVAMADDFLSACDDMGLEAWVDDGEDASFGSGLRLVRHGQGFAGYMSKKVLWMPRSITLFEEALAKKQVTIAPNPVLRWATASAVLTSDPSNNRKWDKRKATGRIDPIVSSCMAIGNALQNFDADDMLPSDFELTVL